MRKTYLSARGGKGNFSPQMLGKLRPEVGTKLGGWEGQSPSDGAALNVPLVLPLDSGMTDPSARIWVLFSEMEAQGELRQSRGKQETRLGELTAGLPRRTAREDFSSCFPVQTGAGDGTRGRKELHWGGEA